jgi:hypothetical protein
MSVQNYAQWKKIVTEKFLWNSYDLTIFLTTANGRLTFQKTSHYYNTM